MHVAQNAGRREVRAGCSRHAEGNEHQLIGQVAVEREALRLDRLARLISGCAGIGLRLIGPYSSLISASVATESTSPATTRMALFGAYQSR